MFREEHKSDKQSYTLVADATVTHATISNEFGSLLRMQFELVKYLFTVSGSWCINITRVQNISDFVVHYKLFNYSFSAEDYSLSWIAYQFYYESDVRDNSHSQYSHRLLFFIVYAESLSHKLIGELQNVDNFIQVLYILDYSIFLPS